MFFLISSFCCDYNIKDYERNRLSQRHLRDWRYNPTHPAPWRDMEGSGLLNDEVTVAH